MSEGEMLGRTNRRFPRVWLSLSVPHEGFAEGGPDALVNAARETGLPLDISRQPALWGGGLRKRASGETTLLSFGGRHLEVATDERHALDLTQAHLIETLSAIGRETLDIYVLKVRRALEEEVITGALAALEDARQEGHIRYFGIQAEGSGLATLGFWQFHDFSELLFVPNNPLQDQARSRLAGLAGERRVGLVGTAPLNWAHDLPAPVVAGALGLASEEAAARALLAAAEGTILVGVRTPREVEIASESHVSSEPPAWLAALVAAHHDPTVYERLAQDARPWVAERARTALGKGISP